MKFTNLISFFLLAPTKKAAGARMLELLKEEHKEKRLILTVQPVSCVSARVGVPSCTHITVVFQLTIALFRLNCFSP